MTVLDKETLTLRKRTIKQGTNSIEIEVRDNKAVGKSNTGGQERPISVDLGGPLFADGATGLSISVLPLKEGYTTTFRNFDLQRQKTKLLRLAVSGSESVTVPAGTFDAFKVEITSADGGMDKMTVWVAKDLRKPVKVSAVLGQMGGATATSELVQ